MPPDPPSAGAIDIERLADLWHEPFESLTREVYAAFPGGGATALAFALAMEISGLAKTSKHDPALAKTLNNVLAGTKCRWRVIDPQ